MKFYTHIITPYGEFMGETLEGTPEQYNGLLEVTKHFYTQEVYFHYLEDGTFFVMGKNLIKDSIVMIKIKEEDESDEVPVFPSDDMVDKRGN